jgi:hypothetical protein
MTVDEYIAEETKRTEHIDKLRAAGSEIEANREYEAMKKWQCETIGFCHGMPTTISSQLRLIRFALKGEI